MVDIHNYRSNRCQVVANQAMLLTGQATNMKMYVVQTKGMLLSGAVGDT
jgi:hypothetical protein